MVVDFLLFDPFNNLVEKVTRIVPENVVTTNTKHQEKYCMKEEKEDISIINSEVVIKLNERRSFERRGFPKVFFFFIFERDVKVKYYQNIFLFIFKNSESRKLFSKWLLSVSIHDISIPNIDKESLPNKPLSNFRSFFSL